MNRGLFKVTKVSSYHLDNAADRLAIFFQLHGNPQDCRCLYETPQPLGPSPAMISYSLLCVVIFLTVLQILLAQSQI